MASGNLGSQAGAGGIGGVSAKRAGRAMKKLLVVLRWRRVTNDAQGDRKTTFVLLEDRDTEVGQRNGEEHTRRSTGRRFSQMLSRTRSRSRHQDSRVVPIVGDHDCKNMEEEWVEGPEDLQRSNGIAVETDLHVCEQEQATVGVAVPPTKSPTIGPQNGPSLLGLPHDILFIVFAQLDVRGVVALTQTCRSLAAVTSTPTIWLALLASYHVRSRLLALDDLTHPTSSFLRQGLCGTPTDHVTLSRIEPSVDMHALKSLVLRTEYLELNWKSPKPALFPPAATARSSSTIVRPSSTDDKGKGKEITVEDADTRLDITRELTNGDPVLANPHSRNVSRITVNKVDYPLRETLYAGPFYISDQFLLLSTPGGAIVGWDMSAFDSSEDEISNEKGKGREGNTEDKVIRRVLARRIGWYETHEPYGLYTVRTDHAARVLHAITCTRHMPGTDWGFNIVKIGLPQPPSRATEKTQDVGKLTFDHIASYSLPVYWRIKTQNLDPTRRRVCALYKDGLETPVSDEDEDDLGGVFQEDRRGKLWLYVLFDWGVPGMGLSIDTGLVHKGRKSSIGLRFAEDGETIHAYALNAGLWTQKVYAISSLVSLHGRRRKLRMKGDALWQRSPSEEIDDADPDLGRRKEAEETVGQGGATARPLIMPPARFSSLPIPDCSLSEEMANTAMVMLPNYLLGPGIQLYQYWNLSQWWLWPNSPYPTRLSRVYFFYIENPTGSPFSVPTADGHEDIARGDGGEHWHVVQFYTDAHRPLDTPGRVFVLPLRKPAIIPLGDKGFPLMGASFNHMGWIEEADVEEEVEEIAFEDANNAEGPVDPSEEGKRNSTGDIEGETPPKEDSPGLIARLKNRISMNHHSATQGTDARSSGSASVTLVKRTRTRSKRIFKLAAFPDPDDSRESGQSEDAYERESRAERTLDDIPEQVLDKAMHVFVEPAMGAVVITTREDEVWRFQYA